MCDTVFLFVIFLYLKEAIMLYIAVDISIDQFFIDQTLA